MIMNVNNTCSVLFELPFLIIIILLPLNLHAIIQQLIIILIIRKQYYITLPLFLALLFLGIFQYYICVHI